MKFEQNGLMVGQTVADNLYASRNENEVAFQQCYTKHSGDLVEAGVRSLEKEEERWGSSIRGALTHKEGLLEGWQGN